MQHSPPGSRSAERTAKRRRIDKADAGGAPGQDPSTEEPWSLHDKSCGDVSSSEHGSLYRSDHHGTQFNHHYHTLPSSQKDKCPIIFESLSFDRMPCWTHAGGCNTTTVFLPGPIRVKYNTVAFCGSRASLNRASRPLPVGSVRGRALVATHSRQQLYMQSNAVSSHSGPDDEPNQPAGLVRHYNVDQPWKGYDASCGAEDLAPPLCL